MVHSKNIIFLLILGLVLMGLLIFYFFFNPGSENFLIKCTFKTVTGLDCPGCGSQRALHSLLHGEVKKAFFFNPLFVLAIPYVIIGILFEWFDLKYTYPKIRKILFGRKSIYIIATLILVFFIYRNI